MEEGESCAKTWVAAALPPPHIYRGKGEGAGPLRSNLRRGRRPGGLPCPPRQGGRLPLGFPQTLRCMGLGGKAPSPLRGWSLSTYSP